MFRLIWYKTSLQDKYRTNEVFELYGDRKSIWNMWNVLSRIMRNKHVEVWQMDGVRLDPELGMRLM